MGELGGFERPFDRNEHRALAFAEFARGIGQALERRDNARLQEDEAHGDEQREREHHQQRDDCERLRAQAQRNVRRQARYRDLARATRRHRKADRLPGRSSVDDGAIRTECALRKREAASIDRRADGAARVRSRVRPDHPPTRSGIDARVDALAAARLRQQRTPDHLLKRAVVAPAERRDEHHHREPHHDAQANDDLGSQATAASPANQRTRAAHRYSASLGSSRPSFSRR